MRIYDFLCETPADDISLSSISRQVAAYIVDVYVPKIRKHLLSTNEPVTHGGDPDVEYTLLSGKPARGGYVAGIPLDEIDEYVFNVGKVGKCMPKSFKNGIYDIVKNAQINLAAFDHDTRDHNAKIALGKSPNIYVSTFLLSSPNAKNVIASNIAHEFRHLKDYNDSGGKAKFIDASEVDDETYLHTGTEANARYTQAANDLILKLETDDLTIDKFKDYLSELFHEYDLDKSDSNKQSKRFISRAYKIYNEYKG